MGRIGLATIVLIGLLAAPAARGAEPAPCSEQSWTGGTTEWCDGTFVYRDYVDDDSGADTAQGSPHGTQLNRATGDVDHRGPSPVPWVSQEGADTGPAPIEAGDHLSGTLANIRAPRSTPRARASPPTSHGCAWTARSRCGSPTAVSR